MKKALPILLAALLLCGLAAGCSRPASSSQSSASTPPVSSQVQSGSTPPAQSEASSASAPVQSTPAPSATTPASSSQTAAPSHPAHHSDIVQPDGLLEESLGATTSAELHLRKGPGTEYEIILTIPLNTDVEQIGYLSNNRLWLFIEYEGQTGWVDLEWLTINENAEPPTGPDVVRPDGFWEAPVPARVTAALHLRKGPGTQYESLLLIPADTTVQQTGYLNDTDEWVLVDYQGTVGWVATDWLAS